MVANQMSTASTRYGTALQVTDDQLVQRCQSGDLDALGDVYARYERAVFRYAYHLLGHREDADDVMQETFFRAFRAMPTFRQDCSLHTWLLKICGNLCRDKMKAQIRRPEVAYDPQVTENIIADDRHSIDPAKIIEKRQTAELILRALRGLPEPQREIIVLYEIEQLRYQQIAQVLGCSEASVKLRLFRARRTFKERVASLMSNRDY